MDFVRSYFGTNERLTSWTFFPHFLTGLLCDLSKSEEKSVQLVRGSFVPKELLKRSILWSLYRLRYFLVSRLCSFFVYKVHKTLLDPRHFRHIQPIINTSFMLQLLAFFWKFTVRSSFSPKFFSHEILSIRSRTWHDVWIPNYDLISYYFKTSKKLNSGLKTRE